MSKYTTTIKNLVKNKFDLGLKDYPIFDENYRTILNNNIINHYYMNEIAFETAQLFKFYLNQKMNEIMPYYNNLYKAQKDIIDNYFDNVDIKETSNRNITSNTTSNSNSNSDSRNLYQDTPSSKLNFNDLENQKWATSYTMNKSQVNDNSSGNGKSIDNYEKILVGNNGGKYKIELLQDIKNNLMNIDLMIINDLNELFMQIY